MTSLTARLIYSFAINQFTIKSIKFKPKSSDRRVHRSLNHTSRLLFPGCVKNWCLILLNSYSGSILSIKRSLIFFWLDRILGCITFYILSICCYILDCISKVAWIWTQLKIIQRFNKKILLIVISWMKCINYGLTIKYITQFGKIETFKADFNSISAISLKSILNMNI